MSEPLTFRTSPGSYAVLCGMLSIPLLACAANFLARGVADPRVLAISVLLPATAAVWLGSLRLRLDDACLDYRDLFGRNFRIPYAQVSALRTEWIYGRYPRSMLHLRDGRRLPINLKPFPRTAYGELSKRLHAAA